MPSTWTDLSDGAYGDQLTPTLYTAITDDLDFLRKPPSFLYAPLTSDSNITTSSTTHVALTGFSGSLTTQGGAILILFTARASSTNARFDILLDSVSITADADAMGAVTPASTFGNNTFFRIVAASAGLHTISVTWKVTTSSGIVYPAGLAQLYAQEIGYGL